MKRVPSPVWFQYETGSILCKVPVLVWNGKKREKILLEKLENGINKLSLGSSDQLMMIKGEPKERASIFSIKDYTILKKWNYYYCWKFESLFNIDIVYLINRQYNILQSL